MISERWVKKHFALAILVSTYSKDNSTKCGAVIVRPNNSIASTGYNDFPRYVAEYVERRDRPTKYLYTEHAERNAIYNCNENMEGYTMFVYAYPNSLFICADCARAIIQSGIKTIYAPHPDNTDVIAHWSDSCEASRIMFDESGVEVRHVDIPDVSNLQKEIEKYLK